MTNRDYFKDENHDDFDEDYEKSYMFKLKMLEELGLTENELDGED